MGKQHFIRRLTTAEATRAAEISGRIGWGHTAQDFQRLIEWSDGGAFGLFKGRENTLLGTSIAYRYGTQRGWIGAVMVEPRYQGQGFGRQLTETAINALAGREVAEIMLDASTRGLGMYERMGFKALHEVHAYTYRVPESAAAPLPDGITPITEADIPDLQALDTAAFGAARPGIIEKMARAYPGWRDAEGFLLTTQGSDQRAHLGPWIHPNDAGAERLLWAALSAFVGKDVTIHIPAYAESTSQRLKEMGFDYLRASTRMIYRADTPFIDEGRYRGAASLALG